jgi:hypothetical protein
MSSYVLEVQIFIPKAVKLGTQCTGNYIHVGYMNYVFKTKTRAAEYYNRYNPHMKSLSKNSKWVSDWDPDTHLRYVVRTYNGETKNIQPFNPLDSPEIKIDRDTNVSITHKPIPK